MTRTTSTLAVSVVAVLVAATALAGVAQGGGEPGSGSDGPAVDAIVEAFDQPREADDDLPAAAASEVALLGPAGTDVLKSVHVLSKGDWDLYLSPADDGLCLSLTDPQGGASVDCQSRAEFEAGPESPAAVLTGCEQSDPMLPPRCSEALLYGVVPDDVREVTVQVETGEAPTSRVENNTYFVGVSLEQSPTAVHFIGDRGSVVKPAGAFPESG